MFPDVFHIEVALASLVPGLYGVQILGNPGDEVSEIVAFRVTN